MEVFTLFFQHLTHPYVNELSIDSTYDLKNKMSNYHHDIPACHLHQGKVKTKKDWSIEIEYGLEETPFFLST